MPEITNPRYQDILESEFSKRRSRNPRYSLRAFARDLATPVQHLSRVLSGKRGLSLASATSIANLLGLAPDVKELFVALVESKHARTKGEKERAIEKLVRFAKSASFKLLDEIAEADEIRWFHLPVYMLFRKPGKAPSPRVVANKIGISVADATATIESLVKRGLITTVEDGTSRQSSPFVHVKAAASTDAIRRLYSDVISLAADSVNGTAPERRAHTAGFLLLNQAQLKLARERVTEFSLELIKEFGNLEETDSQIFAFSTQLFPIERQFKDQQ